MTDAERLAYIRDYVSPWPKEHDQRWLLAQFDAMQAERDALRERVRRAESIVRMWNDGYAPWKGRHRDQCNGLYCDEGCIAQRVETLLNETP